MRKIGFEETKNIELEILKDVAAFCDKWGLRYYLTYGTLIGAVRHKGFIPWDDDIDIWMPRRDYETLIEIYNRENENENYFLVAPEDKLSKHSMVKVIDTRTVKIEEGISYKEGYLGIDIDVFPLDGQPENDEEYQKFYKKMQRLYKLHYYLCLDNKRSIKHRIAISIIRALTGGKKKILARAKKLRDKYPFETSNYIGTVECIYNSNRNRFERKEFENFVMMEFEGYSLRCPIGYDNILTKLYGDYMELPPIEKRATHHKNNAFYKD